LTVSYHTDVVKWMVGYIPLLVAFPNESQSTPTSIFIIQASLLYQ